MKTRPIAPVTDSRMVARLIVDGATLLRSVSTASSAPTAERCRVYLLRVLGRVPRAEEIEFMAWMVAL